MCKVWLELTFHYSYPDDKGVLDTCEVRAFKAVELPFVPFIGLQIMTSTYIAEGSRVKNVIVRGANIIHVILDGRNENKKFKTEAEAEAAAAEMMRLQIEAGWSEFNDYRPQGWVPVRLKDLRAISDLDEEEPDETEDDEDDE